MRKRSHRRESAKALVDQAIRQTLATTSDQTKPPFLHLLKQVQERSEMLRPYRWVWQTHTDRLVEILRGLLALTIHEGDWRRPAEDWEPRESNPLPLFNELTHYLLTDYPVPPVLHSVWFLGIDYRARRQQGWFKHVGTGGSIRGASLPLKLTRRMAHEFAHAPGHYAVEYALRWAQVIGLGGSDDLAQALASTRLGIEFVDDEFWTEVIQFFINHPELDYDQIGPIVDFIQDQRYEPVRVLIGESTVLELDPAQPGFSIKGRTPASLLRVVAEWHARGPAKTLRRLFQWPPSGIGSYSEEAEDGRVWTIRELLDSDALAAEGAAMHHCVATYTPSCVEGTSTIWSLGIESPGTRERVLTIEVEPKSREVVEARMALNEFPDERARAVLVRWGEQEGLTVGCWGVAEEQEVGA